MARAAPSHSLRPPCAPAAPDCRPSPSPAALPTRPRYPSRRAAERRGPRTTGGSNTGIPPSIGSIDLALESSPTLASARARYETARQSVRIASAAAGAHVEANGDFSRQRFSDNGLFSPSLLGFTWYNQADLGLQASYTFDWWGKQREAVEGAMDEAHASQAERSAAALMLTSSIADSYFGWQADEARIAVARERESTLERERSICEARIRAELDPKDELERADSALADVREQIAALDGSAKLRVIALAALVGPGPSGTPRLHARPLPPVDTRVPGRRADRPAFAARRHRRQPLARGGRRAQPRVGASRVLPGHQHQCAGRLAEHGCRDAHRLRQQGTGRDRRDSPADLRCRPSQGALWGGSGGGRFCGGELPGYGGRRGARRGDAGVEPRSNCGGTRQNAGRASMRRRRSRRARRPASGRVSSIPGPSCAPPRPRSRSGMPCSSSTRRPYRRTSASSGRWAGDMT